MSKSCFKYVRVPYRLRDLILPRNDILKEAGVKPGLRVLDYGCGRGSYALPAARLVAEAGKVYALDMNPVSVRKVQSVAEKNHLTNLETIVSDCATGLPSESIDVVLLYDTLHQLVKADAALKEMHRVLRLSGVLSLSDHHLKESEIVSKVTGSGLFSLFTKGKRTYSFSKNPR